MIKRASDRDSWKLENWDEYVKTQRFDQPTDIPELLVFNNSSDEDYKKSLDAAVKAIRG